MVSGFTPPRTPRTPHGVSEPIEPGAPYQDEITFDPNLMDQVIRLSEDYLRLFRKHLDERQRIDFMERAYQACASAGFRGTQAISMSTFKDLLKEW